MSLIVSQKPVNRLPAELVNNAAFVKQVDFLFISRLYISFRRWFASKAAWSVMSSTTEESDAAISEAYSV